MTYNNIVGTEEKVGDGYMTSIRAGIGIHIELRGGDGSRRETDIDYRFLRVNT